MKNQINTLILKISNKVRVHLVKIIFLTSLTKIIYLCHALKNHN